MQCHGMPCAKNQGFQLMFILGMRLIKSQPFFFCIFCLVTWKLSLSNLNCTRYNFYMQSLCKKFGVCSFNFKVTLRSLKFKYRDPFYDFLHF